MFASVAAVVVVVIFVRRVAFRCPAFLRSDHPICAVDDGSTPKPVVERKHHGMWGTGMFGVSGTSDMRAACGMLGHVLYARRVFLLCGAECTRHAWYQCFFFLCATLICVMLRHNMCSIYGAYMRDVGGMCGKPHLDGKEIRAVISITKHSLCFRPEWSILCDVERR